MPRITAVEIKSPTKKKSPVRKSRKPNAAAVKKTAANARQRTTKTKSPNKPARGKRETTVKPTTRRRLKQENQKDIEVDTNISPRQQMIQIFDENTFLDILSTEREKHQQNTDHMVVIQDTCIEADDRAPTDEINVFNRLETVPFEKHITHIEIFQRIVPDARQTNHQRDVVNNMQKNVISSFARRALHIDSGTNDSDIDVFQFVRKLTDTGDNVKSPLTDRSIELANNSIYVMCSDLVEKAKTTLSQYLVRFDPTTVSSARIGHVVQTFLSSRYCKISRQAMLSRKYSSAAKFCVVSRHAISMASEPVSMLEIYCHKNTVRSHGSNDEYGINWSHIDSRELSDSHAVVFDGYFQCRLDDGSRMQSARITVNNAYNSHRFIGNGVWIPIVDLFTTDHPHREILQIVQNAVIGGEAQSNANLVTLFKGGKKLDSEDHAVGLQQMFYLSKWKHNSGLRAIDENSKMPIIQVLSMNDACQQQHGSSEVRDLASIAATIKDMGSFKPIIGSNSFLLDIGDTLLLDHGWIEAGRHLPVNRFSTCERRCIRKVAEHIGAHW